MTKSSISIDLDDPRTAVVAEALSNKTCVKILNLLAEEELTAGDIATRLHIPLNTTGYNIEKLITAGLVEKSKNFFWSVKGKKTPTYKVANRKIVISPKRIIKGVVPAVIGSFLIALGIKSYASTPAVTQTSLADEVSIAAPEFAARTTETATTVFSASNSWLWFLLGSVVAIFIVIIATIISERRFS